MIVKPIPNIILIGRNDKRNISAVGSSLKLRF